MTTCEYAELDGAYVLGALSPIERQEFEEHLTTCKNCSRSVRELAGMPGLLSRVDPVDLEPPANAPVPDTLLPSLVREARRTGRRRVYASVGVAAAAAVAIGALLVGDLRSDSPSITTAPTSSPSATLAVGESMHPIGHVPVRATLTFASVTWGTKIHLTCTYEHAAGEGDASRTKTYGLFVVNRDGKAEQVGTWRALDGRTTRLTAGTAETRDDIASVEIRTADGRPVLQLAS
jgi:hypothetical protein